MVSETALIAYNEAFLGYQVAINAKNAAVSSWTSISNIGSTDPNAGQSVIGSSGLKKETRAQSKEHIAFQQFYGYWRDRTLFTVQTPWAVFQNMAIKSLRAVQDAETRVITDFEVTFKMIRTVKTASTPGIAKTVQGRLAAQGASATDLSATAPPPSIPLADGLTQMGATP